MMRQDSPGLLSRATVREILIVVTGIMIAFALDAWWDRSSTTASLRQQAELVLDELRAAESELQSAVDTHRRLMETAQSLAGLLEALPSDGGLSVPDTTLADLMVQYTVDIGSPSMESFLDAGGSRLIDDPEEVRLARSWPIQLEDTMDDQVFLRESYTVPLARYLRSRYSLGRSETTNHEYRAALFFNDPGMMANLEFEDVLITPEMELVNLLNARVAKEKHAMVTLGLVLDMNRDLIELFDDI